jgi:hypothetical protein
VFLRQLALRVIDALGVEIQLSRLGFFAFKTACLKVFVRVLLIQINGYMAAHTVDIN